MFSTLFRSALWGVLALAPQVHAEGLLAVQNPATVRGETALYAELDAFEGSDALPVRAFGANWGGAYTPKSGTNLALAVAQAETGVQWNHTRLGALYRAQALVRANRDTMDLARQYNTGSAYDSARTYGLDYRLVGFVADGVRFSHSREIPAIPSFSGWTLHGGVGVALLQGRQLKVESASGQVKTLGGHDLDANVAWNNLHSGMNTGDPATFNPFVRSPGELTGAGWALDVGVRAEHANGWRLELAANDVAGEILWNNVPQRVSTLNTSTRYYDANGYVQFNPLASASSRFINYRQALDTRWRMALGYAIRPATQVQWATNQWGDVALTEWLVSHRFDNGLEAQVSHAPHFGSVGFQLRWKGVQVGLRSDAMDLWQAHAYGLTLGYVQAF